MDPWSMDLTVRPETGRTGSLEVTSSVSARIAFVLLLNCSDVDGQVALAFALEETSRVWTSVNLVFTVN